MMQRIAVERRRWCRPDKAQHSQQRMYGRTSRPPITSFACHLTHYTVSGRQKPDFQMNSASIDKKKGRVGSPLVRYFEGTAISPLFGFPFVSEVEALASIARWRGRWLGCIWSAREVLATMRDRPEQRPLGIVAQAAAVE